MFHQVTSLDFKCKVLCPQYMSIPSILCHLPEKNKIMSPILNQNHLPANLDCTSPHSKVQCLFKTCKWKTIQNNTDCSTRISHLELHMEQFTKTQHGQVVMNPKSSTKSYNSKLFNPIHATPSLSTKKWAVKSGSLAMSPTQFVTGSVAHQKKLRKNGCLFFLHLRVLKISAAQKKHEQNAGCLLFGNPNWKWKKYKTFTPSLF